MEGVVAISQRMAGIQQQLSALSAPPPPAIVDTAGTFDQMFTAAATEFSPATAIGGVNPAAVLNAEGVPADLAVYGNGKVPDAALMPIDSTGHKLWAPAGIQFQKLLAAASAQGVDIGINDSYRTYDRQVELVDRLGLYPEGGLAAVPGTSRHGWGMAVDLQLGGEALSWMRNNAEQFGFVEDTPRETWHWAFYPDRVRASVQPHGLLP